MALETESLDAAIDRALAAVPLLSTPPPPPAAPAEPVAPVAPVATAERVKLPRPRLESHRRVVDALPNAQREVLRMLLDGMTLPQIAEARERSLETVKNQTRVLHKKFGVQTRGELLSLFLRKA